MGYAAPLDGEVGHWWRKPFGMLQTNLREIDVDMSVDDVASYIEQYGADAWLISIGGIQAQYPTELSFHTKNPHVEQRKSGDLISDALDAARSKGLRLLARMDFSKVSESTAAEHPEWCFKSPTGNLQKHTGDLVSACPSAGYYQERIFETLEEVTRRYPVDGFFINWTTMNEEDYYKRYHGVCHCESCQSRWATHSGGLELPKGPSDDNYAEWLQFSREVIDELTARIHAYIGSKLPSACLILGKSADIMFHEANNAVGRELWHHATSETVSTWMSYRPNVPVLVNSTTFMDMPYRMASEEPLHFAQYLLQAMSRGGYPSTYMMAYPGRLPYTCMELGAKITQFYKKWRTVYNGLRPVAKTAIVRPDRAKMSQEPFNEALSEFRGLYTAMKELHVPFDVIAHEFLAATAQNGGLKRYEAITLPNLGKLKPEEADALDDWVKSGGRLIATAGSGVDDGGNMQLNSLPAHRQLLVDRQRDSLWSSYYALPQETASPHDYTGPMVPLYGASHLYQWKVNSQGGYKLLARAPFSPPEKSYGNIQVDQRGYGTWKYGSGAGIVIPFTVGRGYHELGLSVYRDFYGEILREHGAVKEDISCSIAEQVEVTINSNGPKTIIHLINMSGARKQNFGTHLPIPAGIISTSRKDVTAYALQSDTPLEVVDGKIMLPTLDLFEVVVIE